MNRAHKNLLLALLTVTVAMPIFPSASPASISVPLKVDETSGTDRYQDPVTSGVPIPKSENLTGTGSLAVTDSGDRAVPAQFTVEARWGGSPDDTSKPIKWVLVDFATSVKSNDTATYNLTNSGGNTQPRNAVSISRDAGSGDYTVSTGVAKYLISTSSFDLFKQVYVDNDRDGTVDEPILASGAGNSAVLKSGGVTYDSAYGAIEDVEIELEGPVRSVLKVRGWHYSASGGGKSLAYTARLIFHANSGAVKVLYTVWNDLGFQNVNGQPNYKGFETPNTLSVNDLRLKETLNTDSKIKYRLSGTEVGRSFGGYLDQSGEKAQLYQASSGGAQWNHQPDNSNNPFRGFKATGPDATGGIHNTVCTGNDPAVSDQCRAIGWAQATSEDGGIAIGVRDFWENYPKTLDIGRDGSVSVGLFPEDQQTPYLFRSGEQKTHEVVYLFHRGTAPRRYPNPSRQMTALLNPIQAWAPASWYLEETGTFSQSVARNPSTYPDYEDYVDAGVLGDAANYFIVHEGLVGTGWVFSDRAEQWSWRNAGDTIAEDETPGGSCSNCWPIFTNQQYDHPWMFVSQAVRSLGATDQPDVSSKWWSLAPLSARQQVDIDIAHSRCSGNPSEACMLEGDPNSQYPVGWAMGTRFTNQDHEDPSADIHRHALVDMWSGGIHGLMYYSYLTGDPAVEDGWQENAKAVRWQLENSPCNQNDSSSCNPGYADVRHGVGDIRRASYALEIMTDAYLATGEEGYLNAAKTAVEAMNPEGRWAEQVDINPLIEPSGSQIAPWAMGLEMRSLGYYLDAIKNLTGVVDEPARDALLRNAKILERWWQPYEDKPIPYYVFENGGTWEYNCYNTDNKCWIGDPSLLPVADGMAWAVDYDDGAHGLDKSLVEKVAGDAYAHAAMPWGPGYAKDTFTSSKTQALLSVSGWRYLRYAKENPGQACIKNLTSNNDTLTGTTSDEVICGLMGNDTITGEGGKDTLYGYSGDDMLNTTDGDPDDRIEAGPGTDTCTVDEGDITSDCEQVVSG